MTPEETIMRATQQMKEPPEFQETVTEVEVPPRPVDYYQKKRNESHRASQLAQTAGSPAEMYGDAESVIGRIDSAYKQAKARHELTGQGGYDYMEQYLLPAIETLTAAYGPDAVLNNKKVIDLLDSRVIGGNGVGNGYTSAFIRALDKGELGSRASATDREVTSAIRDMRMLDEQNQIRAAVNTAEKIKHRIDSGELSASPEDYAFISRVVAR